MLKEQVEDEVVVVWLGNGASERNNVIPAKQTTHYLGHFPS